MGGRLLRQWLRFPLRDIQHITARQQAIEVLVRSPAELGLIRKQLEGMCDIERVVSRIAVARASPRDLSVLGKSLALVGPLIDRFAGWGDAAVVAPELVGMAEFCRERSAFLTRAIGTDPAPHVREGGVIAPGFDPELDRLRQIFTSGQQWLAEHQAALATSTGINSLKVGYNKVFGYYIEVTDAHRQKVPPEWNRRQTVKNAERYITDELKRFEHESLTARDRSIALEQQIFERVRQEMLPHLASLGDLAAEIARLDVLCGLASLAIERRYCRPRRWAASRP
jgi:DNA mismatch repair protein MutS